jgi:hypothetical protein
VNVKSFKARYLLSQTCLSEKYIRIPIHIGRYIPTCTYVPTYTKKRARIKGCKLSEPETFVLFFGGGEDEQSKK